MHYTCPAHTTNKLKTDFKNISDRRTENCCTRRIQWLLRVDGHHSHTLFTLCNILASTLSETEGCNEY
jgi:hypothetical protein